MRSSLLLFLACACILALVGSPFASVSAASSIAPYNATLAGRLLRFAGAAYCPSSSIEGWSCGFCTEAPLFQPWGITENTTTNMLAFAGYDEESATIVVSFRGTELLSILDWVENLDYHQIPALCDGCLVHEGFYGDYMSIRDGTVQTIRDLRGAYPNAPIVITGHSLGGALVELASVDLALNENITPDLIYNFGAPRVGNDIWVQQFQTLFWDTTAYRVTHAMDPVPHVPFEKWGFVHPPTEVYYNELNTQFQVCDGSGEDPNCADQWLLPVNAMDHGTYLGCNFFVEFAKCTF